MTHVKARGVLMLAMAGTTLSGCVERKLFITSEPTGALVRLNDVQVGVTPVEVEYTWYGKYDVQLEKDGYEPLSTTAKAKAPLHSIPGLDVVVGLWPGTVKEHVKWHFELQPSQYEPDEVLQRAEAMRDEVFVPEPVEPGEPPE